MQQLQLWIRIMRKVIIYYFLIIGLLVELFSETVTMIVPNYLKVYADGFFTYQFHFDVNGRLSKIYTDYEKNNCNIEYKSENNIVLNYIDLKQQKLLNLDDYRFSNSKLTNLNTVRLSINNQIIDTHIEECVFKNSINYIIDSKTKEYICKYEYDMDRAGNYIITYARQMEYDSVLKLNWYSPWADKIIIKNLSNRFIANTNLSISRDNLIVLYAYNSVLAQLMYPFYFSSNVTKYSFNTYTASSFLTENKIMYNADNLQTITGLPWVSGNGDGVGDKISINFDSRSNLSFAFYNGFQSEQKPYLYNLNSRVKKIKATCIETKKSKVFDLRDTDKKQIISVDEVIGCYGEVVTIEFEIIDVYYGSKYKDLCIQAIVPEIRINDE